MQTYSNQLCSSDICSDVLTCLLQDKPKLIELFEQYTDLSKQIPQSFLDQYYASTGHLREYKLSLNL